MHERQALGPADVSDPELARMVAALLDVQSARLQLLSSYAEPVDYAIPAITTASRTRVRGDALVDGERVGYRLFVKHVQSWGRSPLFAQVPEEMRDLAEAGVPWRTEALVYRSDLAAHLPDGLTMPRAVGVHDLDEKSAAVWLEDVPARQVVWDPGRFVRAAGLLGRLAGSSAVAAFARVGEFDWSVADYLNGRLAGQVLPMLHSEELWQHPLVASSFDDALRRRLLAAADRATGLTEELMSFPVRAGHGDACTNNLLVRGEDDPTFTMIDFGFWLPLPVGHDLGQLLVGDVQLGRRGSADLAELDEACLAAYVAGLHAEGFTIDAAAVRRAHALQLIIFTGLSMPPFDLIGGPVTPELQRIAAERAAIARYCLDLLDATG